ncbi:hypothetical protein EC968_002582 [Mortierella alpina]|nr:hypothetical protein EC968_002582 [Mortierella alpina]
MSWGLINRSTLSGSGSSACLPAQRKAFGAENPRWPLPKHHGLIELDRRQFPLPGTSPASTSTTQSTASTAAPTNTATTAVITSTASTSAAVITHTSTAGGTSRSSVGPVTTTGTATGTPSPTGDSEKSDNGSAVLVPIGAALGGGVFLIGLGIMAFRCTLNRRERQRRNKEMAATLAENFDRSGDPIASPRKGYLELGEGPPTPSPGHLGANLSRQGSQDAYYAGKDGSIGGGGGGDYYNNHYVQERYGGAHAGNYGMYEETELSVIGGNSGRPTTPYMDPYPPSSAPSGHYGGYNGGGYDAGYYGGSGQAPRGPQGY